MKMTQFKVRNMQTSKGNDVPNQFIIDTPEGTYFQSYESIIVFIPDIPENNPMCTNLKGVKLDKQYWDYSKTTGKYRNKFLGEGIADTRKKIKDGEYKLADLN